MTYDLLNSILKYLDIAAPFIALSFVSFKKEMWLGEHFFIVLYLMTQLLLNIWCKVIMLADYEGGNIYVYKINCIVSFVILSLYFYAKWKHHLTKQKLQLYLLFTLLMSIVLTFIVLREVEKSFNSTSFSLESLIICTYCISYYLAKLKNPYTEKITEHRTFWFVTGLFTYHAGCFFIFVSYNVLTFQLDTGVNILWLIHNLIFTFMCMLFLIGFRCKYS